MGSASPRRIKMKKRTSTEKGQVIVLLVLGLVGLLALTALAIDGGNAFSDRRNAQNAADNAVVAAAYAWLVDSNADYRPAGDTIINANGYTGANSTWTYDASGITCSNGADGITIMVTLNTNVDTYFARIVGWDELNNQVVAQGRACKVGPPVPLYANYSLFSTKETSCSNINAGVGFGGTSQTTFLGGGAGSASSDSDCIMFVGNSNTTTFKNCANISIEAPGPIPLKGNVTWPDGCGGRIYNNPFPDPPDDLGISCTTDVTVSGSSMSPGTYDPANFGNAQFPPAGITNLEPGTYCVKGEFILNGGQTLTGNGVTIVMQNGGISWNGGAAPQLNAPGNGSLKGLLIYAPPTNSSTLTFNGNGDSLIQGTVLAQSAVCNYLGTYDTNTNTPVPQSIQLICYTIQLSGDQEAIIVYNPDVLYTPQEPPSYELLR
jgi:Flp pilus assembly protein TadG